MTTRSEAIAERALRIQEYNPVTGNLLSDAKDILLRFLQEYFYQMPANQNLFHFEPGEDWQTEEIQSEVIITDAGAVNTDTIEKRPAIILSRGPFAFGNLGMDNLVGINGTDGKRTHSDLMNGAFNVTCISRLGLEAEKMALMVAKAIKIYRRDLQLAGFFQIGQQITIGPESPASTLFPGDSDEDYVMVTVSLPAYWQERWTSVGTGLSTLNNIKLTVTNIARQFNGTLLYADSISSEGVVNSSSEGVIIQAWTA